MSSWVDLACWKMDMEVWVAGIFEGEAGKEAAALLLEIKAAIAHCKHVRVLWVPCQRGNLSTYNYVSL